jgi:hypothetical protein
LNVRGRLLALILRAPHVEARRQHAREQHDLDAQWHCERELTLLWRQWLTSDDG